MPAWQPGPQREGVLFRNRENVVGYALLDIAGATAEPFLTGSTPQANNRYFRVSLKTSDDVSEGVRNLFFSDTRATGALLTDYQRPALTRRGFFLSFFPVSRAGSFVTNSVQIDAR